MYGYHGNIEKITIENNNFRKVLYTDKRCQLVVMSLPPGEEIGMETHQKNDQFLRIEQGTGEAILNDESHELGDGTVIIVPAGTKHNIIGDSCHLQLTVRSYSDEVRQQLLQAIERKILPAGHYDLIFSLTWLAETAEGRVDSYAPDAFKYTITAREIKA